MGFRVWLITEGSFQMLYLSRKAGAHCRHSTLCLRMVRSERLLLQSAHFWGRRVKQVHGTKKAA